MHCRHCSADNPREARYCCTCGVALADRTRPVESLDTPVSRDAMRGATADHSIPEALRRLMPDQFLDKLISSRGRIEAERRVVTILFCDVKGSTTLAESLDPEEVMGIMNGAFEAMIDPVARYGGTLARLMGDGILAFFGAPVAHEDDPARACRASLDILARIGTFARRLEKERGLKGFNVRVGINTGLVVVGEVGTALRVEYTAMGDAVNVAARMEATADPGTIRLTEATWRLVNRSFDAEPLGGVEVKGKSRPVRAYRLTGTASSGTRGAVIHSPLVGRRSELRTITGSAAALTEGKSSVVALIGEAGVGKSRLVTEAQSAFPGLAWFHCRAVPDGVLTGDSMVRQLLASLCGAGHDTPPGELDAALRQTLAASVPQASSETYIYLARLLNVSPTPNVGALLESIDAGTIKLRTAAAFTTFLDAIADRQPLVLVWDDLHFIDPPSADLLSALLGSPEKSPMLIILVSRPGEDHTGELFRKAAEGRASRYHAVELHPLLKNDARQLLANILGDRPLPPTIRREILEKTGGNAFFLEEVLRSMIDSGELGRNHRGTRRTGGPPPTVPDTVAGVITARMDRLNDTSREVLQASAVIGRNFRSRVLAATLGLVHDDTRFLKALTELSKKDFIATRNGGTGLATDTARAKTAEDSEYFFKHGITREVVYGSLLIPHRRELHRRVGESMEGDQRLPSAEIAVTLAFHFDRAGVIGKAYRYTLAAAEQAKRTYAGQEAVMHYIRALSLASDAGAGDSAVAGIHDSLGEVFAFLGRYQDAIANFESAISAGPRPGATAVILRKRARVYEQWGRYEEADADLQKALSELNAFPDRSEEARVRIGLARVCYRRGELDIAASLGDAALAEMDLCRDPAGIAEACNILGNIHARRLDLPKALSFYDRSRLLWEELRHQGGLAVSYNNLGQVYHQLERWDEAINHYLQSLRLSERIGDRYGSARTSDNLSQVYSELGNQDEAMKCLKRAVDIFREIGSEGSTVVPEMWMQSGTL